MIDLENSGKRRILIIFVCVTIALNRRLQHERVTLILLKKNTNAIAGSCRCRGRRRHSSKYGSNFARNAHPQNRSLEQHLDQVYLVIAEVRLYRNCTNWIEAFFKLLSAWPACGNPVRWSVTTYPIWICVHSWIRWRIPRTLREVWWSVPCRRELFPQGLYQRKKNVYIYIYGSKKIMFFYVYYYS